MPNLRVYLDFDDLLQYDVTIGHAGQPFFTRLAETDFKPTAKGNLLTGVPSAAITINAADMPNPAAFDIALHLYTEAMTKLDVYVELDGARLAPDPYKLKQKQHQVEMLLTIPFS